MPKFRDFCFTLLLVALCLFDLCVVMANDVSDSTTAESTTSNTQQLTTVEFSATATTTAEEERSNTDTDADADTDTETDTNTDTEARPALRTIYSLSNHCVDSHCYNFHYDSLDEVAFFDLKAEVRINNDDATYDIISPRVYDTLIFENSTFAHFPLHLFYSLVVKELDLRNCSIQVVTWECFLMSQNLQILLLTDNQLEYIGELTFKFANELQYLFLDSNRLKSLHSNSFYGLNELKYLNLRYNQLKQLPAGIFDSLPALQELHLSDNHLRIINNELFANNSNLLLLTLSMNYLWRLEREALRAQTNLALLDVSHNPRLRTLVMSLHTHHLVANNCSLTRINLYGRVRNADLSDNHIKELYFTQPEELEMLNLRNNSLEQIASLTRASKLMALNLGDNPRMGTLPVPWQANALQRLDLGNTGLKQLPIDALAEQTALRYLNVSHNQLREINPTNFKYLSQLIRFDIKSNDWNCYNLNLMMDMLLRPYAIAYERDRFDPEFPGEYINDIACMYRIEEDEAESESELELDSETTAENVWQKNTAVSESVGRQHYSVLTITTKRSSGGIATFASRIQSGCQFLRAEIRQSIQFDRGSEYAFG